MTEHSHNAASQNGQNGQNVKIGDWYVSPSACTLKRQPLDAPATEVKVTPRSMDVLRLLIENAGSVVSTATLLESIWQSPIATDHAVHKAIAELRAALQDDAHKPQYIKTVPKRGYTLIAPVFPIPPTAAASLSPPPMEGASETPSGPAAAAQAKGRGVFHGGWFRGMVAGLLLALVAALPLLPDGEQPVSQAGGMIRLAVMPFTIQDYNDDNQILAEGVRDSLVHGLSKLSHLQVMSPPRSSGYRTEASPARADYLKNADHALQGSVFSGNGRLRVIVQLVRQSDGVQQYSEQFDLPLNDIFSVQDEIASNVASALRIHLDEQERNQMLDWGTGNALAYENFLRAEFYYNQFNPEDFHRAMAHYEAAIALDPDFLSAYHGLATAANNLAVYSSMDTIDQLYGKVLDVYREVSRLDPDSDILDSLQAIKLRMQGSNHEQQERQLRAHILSGSPPDFAIAHYALLLIGARLYDEASQLLDLVADSSPYEISPDEVWSYRYSVEPPPALIMARKNQLQQRPYHIGFLGTVAANLAFLGDFRQAQIYLDQQRSVDSEGIIVHNTENTVEFLKGNITPDSAAFTRALKDDPDFFYNNGALSFMVGDIDRGMDYWRQLQPRQMRRLFNMAHVSERYFPDQVLDSPRYHALLEELGNGLTWQRTLMEGVMAISGVTAVQLSETARAAYDNQQLMVRNNLWTREQWQEFELHKRQRLGNFDTRENLSSL